MFRTVEACLTCVSKKVGSNLNELATLFLMDWDFVFWSQYDISPKLMNSTETQIGGFRRFG